MKLRAGDDARRNWVAINRQSDALEAAQRELDDLRRQVLALRSEPGVPVPTHPARIFQHTPDPETPVADTDWRTLWVEGFRINGTIVTKTTEDPDDGADDIVVPEDTEVYLIWVKVVCTLSTSGSNQGELSIVSATVEHGADGWPGYPNQPAWTDPPASGAELTAYCVIGQVDTVMRADYQVADIRQNIRSDLYLACVMQACVTGEPKRRLRFIDPQQSW
jgi:hypothetical protein